jgi:hypothetical protein
VKHPLRYFVAIASVSATLALASPGFAAEPSAAAKPAAAAKPVITDMQILMEKIRADKKLLVADNLILTEAEAKAFWPVYDAYQKDLTALNKRLKDLVLRYADEYSAGAVADDAATKMINESIAIDVAEAQLRKTYAPKVQKALPGWKAARYLQIESKIRAAIRYELADAVPLAE